MLSIRTLAAGLLMGLLYCHVIAAAESAPASPLSPAEAQKLFQLPAEVQIELVAAEPEVIDPVAIRFDEEGRIWVAEMRDYPLGPPPGGNQHSQIRVLEDRDRDGRFETSTVFADNLHFVTGMQPWKGGVFVTLSGAVKYMKDTNGDGRADLDETWFEGFAEQNTQLRANHPRLGLDNKIYIANGLRGGSVVSKRNMTTSPINISGMDFRFDPLTGQAEAVSGNGQFGLCFDDFGNRFTCSNRNPCRHAVLEDRYLKQNPGVAVPAVMHDVANFGEESRVFPISRAWTTSNLHAGQFTAACGVYVYRGDLLPAEYQGNVFTCDPTGNFVHREIMKPNGATFTGKSPYSDKEFLASTDEWFRPVNMELGPDGALYVVDMYRCVIEHPDFVPTELKSRPDQRLGDDRGRIWRIVPAKQHERRPRPQFTSLKSEELVPLLAHENAWQRETAQRLLLERGAKPLTEAIRAMATSGSSPQGRSHALRLLRGLGQLTTADCATALSDSDTRVRRQGLLLAEGFDPQAGVEPAKLFACLESDNAALQFQSILSLARLAPQTFTTERDWGEVLLRLQLDDPWVRQAIRLAASDTVSVNFALALDKSLGRAGRKPSAGQIEMFRQLAEQSCGKTFPKPAIALLTEIFAGDAAHLSPTRLAMLQGLARGAVKQKSSLEAVAAMDASGKNGLGLRAAAEQIATLAGASESDAATRTGAISLLGYLPGGEARLLMLIEAQTDQATRAQAVTALALRPSDEPWKELLSQFPTLTPTMRRAVVDGVLSRPTRAALLLVELEAKRIKPTELDPAQSTRLLQHRDAQLKARAAKIFGSATPEDRIKALAEYQPVLKMKGDALRGRTVFEKNCATCHKIGNIGVNVAPEISDSRTKTPAQLLADILQPNRAIDSNYVAYSLLTTDGNALTGILTLETATSITLKQPGDKTVTVSRSEIDLFKSSGVSLMPEGLEKNIPPQDMADLLAFIKNWRYLDGKTPLAQ